MKSERFAVCVAMVATVVCSANAWTISAVGEYDSGDVTGLSGITWAGGNKFYLVNDGGEGSTGYIHPAQININPASGAISSVSISSQSAAIALSGVDAEGVAYDPATMEVYVSNETGPTIKSYSTMLAASAVPRVTVAGLGTLFAGQVGNKSLEALTISGDGLTMWTCNEEAISADGDRATTSAGTVVRLTKFVRPNLTSTAWECSGQWKYLTDKIVGSKLSDSNSHGVSDLAVLPDGTLLVLERDCSLITFHIFDDSDIIKVLIYAVPPSELIDDYKIGGKTPKVVNKGSALWSAVTGMANYEGMCIGPRLNDGSTSLLLVSDGDPTGGYDFKKRIYALKLKGGGIVSLDSSLVNNGEGCVPYPPNGPYRYMENSSVTVKLDVPKNEYSEIRSAAGITLGGGSSGTVAASGNTVTFKITGDHTTVTWDVHSQSVMGAPFGDSFERYDVGQALDGVHGWTGEGIVKAQNYSKPTIGYPMPNEAHSQVLALDGDTATRAYSLADGANAQMDFMVCPTWLPKEPGKPDGDLQVAVCVAADGAIMIYHATDDGTSAKWTTIPEVKLSNNKEWMRVSLAFDYSTPVSFVQVRVNGGLCPSADGFAAAAQGSARGGAWYRCVGTSRKVNELCMSGCGMLDDVVVSNAVNVAFDTFPIDGIAKTNDAGFAYADLYAAGLPLSTQYDADGDGKSALVERMMGSDPGEKDGPFEVKDIKKDDGVVTVAFTGKLNGFNRFVLLGCNELADGFAPKMNSDTDGEYLESKGGLSTWTVPISGEDAPRFFKIRAELR